MCLWRRGLNDLKLHSYLVRYHGYHERDRLAMLQGLSANKILAGLRGSSTARSRVLENTANLSLLRPFAFCGFTAYRLQLSWDLRRRTHGIPILRK